MNYLTDKVFSFNKIACKAAKFFFIVSALAALIIFALYYSGSISTWQQPGLITAVWLVSAFVVQKIKKMY